MDTQNTPVHITLWHRDFWMLALANVLLMSGAYAQITGLPAYLLGLRFSTREVGCSLGIFGLGIFALGGLCSYLVQRYRRNQVCMWAILGVALCSAVLFYADHFLRLDVELWMVLAMRFCMGAFLGLAQMTLASTLVIDTCESFQRTEANYLTSWFARFGLALGPLGGIFMILHFGSKFSLLFSVLSSLGALVLVSLVKFPFRAPDEHVRRLSLDRFFLPQGLPLFANVVLVAAAFGALLAYPHSEEYYMMMGTGLVVAFFTEKYVFADADLKSEVLTGLLMMAAAVLIMTTSQAAAIEFVAPALSGFAAGIMGSRFLLFYIKLAKHCQRGTSMSSFFLAWELGLSLGLFLGYGVLQSFDAYTLSLAAPILDRVEGSVIALGLSLLAASFVLYNFFVHPWYMRHRNR